jgi:MOSC domain-containing protein YiiM
MSGSIQVTQLSGAQQYSKKAEKSIPNLDILQSPFSGERIVQIRTGKIKPLYKLPVTSAIYKSPRKDVVYVTLLDCERDEHAYEFHGGPDKALHQYCSSRYAIWKSDHPQSAHHFNIGGFGENLVGSIANERNVCIGDMCQIGEEVEVQVSLPRQPCFKLYHRFEVKDMSQPSQEKSRTGMVLQGVERRVYQAWR